MPDAEHKSVGDKPAITETQWQAAAIATALLSVILGIAGSFWILGLAQTAEITPDDMASRGRALTPIGTFLIAIVTFCTVAWRAKVTERQADAQERQLVSIERQAASADENNLAILLQKGAELIEEKSLQKNMAGIATLGAVVTAENRRFGAEGMSLLSRYLEKRHSKNFTTHLPRAAKRALKDGFRNGNSTTAILYIDGGGKAVKWEPIWGVRRVEFRNGTVTDLPKSFGKCSTPHKFSKVTFRQIKIAVRSAIFDECHFDQCQIIEFETYGGDRNTYDRCNFSGCRVHFDPHDEGIDLSSLSNSENYFYAETPPLQPADLESFDWGRYLREEKGIPFFEDDDIT